MAELPESDAPAELPALPASTLRRVWRVARYVIGLVLGGLAIYAISGKTGELSGAGDYLDHLNWAWLAFAAGAEAASYLAFAAMQCRLMASGRVRVSLRAMTKISLAGNVIQTSLPGGIVISAAWSFRQFRRFGADDVLAGWMLIAMTAVSMISLSALAGVGLAMAASTGSSLGLVGVIIGLIIGAGILVGLWSKRSYLIRHAIGAVRLSHRVVHHPVGDPHDIVHNILTKAGGISPSWGAWGWAMLWASLNWIFDMGCLILAFEAVGAGVPWEGLLLAYAAAQLATNLPITPGGLGVVEGSLTVALVAFGGAQASTVAAVLVYRILSFWLMLPIGWGTLGWLTLGHRRQAGRTRALALGGGGGVVGDAGGEAATIGDPGVGGPETDDTAPADTAPADTATDDTSVGDTPVGEPR